MELVLTESQLYKDINDTFNSGAAVANKSIDLCLVGMSFCLKKGPSWYFICLEYQYTHRALWSTHTYFLSWTSHFHSFRLL